MPLVVVVVGGPRSPSGVALTPCGTGFGSPLEGNPDHSYRLAVMTTGGARGGRPRWGRLVGILVAVTLVIGGAVACQAIRASSPEYQCEQGNAVWVEGYGTDEPYCATLTPKQPRH